MSDGGEPAPIGENAILRGACLGCADSRWDGWCNRNDWPGMRRGCKDASPIRHDDMAKVAAE